MKQDLDNKKHWITDNDKTFIRKIDGYNMGSDIFIGNTDSIDNYEEVEIKDESYE